MNAFAGTSAYYRRFRPGIPAALAVLLDQAAPTSSPRRLLDIGSGPGLVVRALLPYFDDLFAVDAEPGMLTEAEAMLRPSTPPTGCNSGMRSLRISCRRRDGSPIS
ncbi:hypothetical protein ACQ86D_00180 [Streptomyces galilaeus]